jgi:hypothetical protein
MGPRLRWKRPRIASLGRSYPPMRRAPCRYCRTPGIAPSCRHARRPPARACHSLSKRTRYSCPHSSRCDAMRGTCHPNLHRFLESKLHSAIRGGLIWGGRSCCEVRVKPRCPLRGARSSPGRPRTFVLKTRYSRSSLTLWIEIGDAGRDRQFVCLRPREMCRIGAWLETRLSIMHPQTRAGNS